jgi:hypothetical protein
MHNAPGKEKALMEHGKVDCILCNELDTWRCFVDERDHFAIELLN